MSVGQMCWHCQYPLKLAITNKPDTSKGNWFVKTFFKKSLYSDKPWRKNLPTAPQLKTKENKDFTSEHEILKSLVNDFNLYVNVMTGTPPCFWCIYKRTMGLNAV
jgi:hypothetical protein